MRLRYAAPQCATGRVATLPNNASAVVGYKTGDGNGLPRIAKEFENNTKNAAVFDRDGTIMHDVNYCSDPGVQYSLSLPTVEN